MINQLDGSWCGWICSGVGIMFDYDAHSNALPLPHVESDFVNCCARNEQGMELS